MADKQPDILAIFTECLALDSDEERSRYLDNACQEDLHVRGRVEELLRAHSDAGNFMGGQPTPVTLTIDQSSISEELGTYIGPYKLVEEIGEGGMGAVYLALQQEPIRRKVALKVIKPGMDSKQVIHRFEAERQALAMMDHPSIAKVHDGGTTDSGRPYFVMELVKGIPITKYADQHKLSTRDRLGLFSDVCGAVQHAHQKGIIHRDLKPSNILVAQLDDKATPKVIDFGIAKATHGQLMDGSLVTAYSQMVGTPMYMSPEQAEPTALDVDTRSDVYSLGVLLYELLTGTTPFDRERMSSVSFDEFRRIVREEDPPRPSTRLSTMDAALDTVAENHHASPRLLRQQLSGELDWIVMKALEKDRSRRYGSASEFAKDVQRYLDDEPVEACPPSTSYRLKKFANRNRAMITFAALLLLTLLAGIAATTWQAAQAIQARKVAEAEQQRAETAAANEAAQRKEAERQRQIAQENFERARDAVDEYLTRVSQEELLNTPGLQPLRKDLLELALKYYQEFVAERRHDQTLQADLAAAYSRVGDITSEIGSKEEALSAHSVGLQIRKTLLAEKPDSTEYRNDLAVSFRKLGALQAALGKRNEAIESFEQSVSIWQALSTISTNLTDYRSGLAKTYELLGLLRSESGNHEKAIGTLQEAVQIQGQLVSDNADKASFRYGLASSLNALGIAQKAAGHGKEAMDSYQQAIDILLDLRDREPGVAKYGNLLAGCYNNAGLVQDSPAERLKWIEKAIQVEEEIVVQNPSVTSYQVFLANMLHNFASINCGLRKRDDALPAYTREIEIRKNLIEMNPTVADYQHALAKTYSSLGLLEPNTADGTEKLAYFKKAVVALEKLVAENPSVLKYQFSLAQELGRVGEMHRAAGRHDDALAPWTKGRDVMASLIAKDPSRVDYIYELERLCYSIATIYQRNGKPEEAMATQQQVIDILAALVEAHPSDFRYRDLLAGCYLNTGNLPDDYIERLKWYDQAVECYEELIEQDPPGLDYQRSLTNTLVNIANCQKRQGRIQAAIETWHRLIEIREEYVKFAEEEPEFTSNRKTLAASMQSLAKLLKDEGDLEQAIRYRQKAITVRRAVAERFPERTLDILKLFDDLKKHAELLSVAGHAKEAEAAYRDALAVWDATGDELAADMTDPAARASVHMRLASYLVECPLVELRDTNRAVELATKAIELWPDEPGAWGTLGICHYRAGNWKRANASVEKSLELLSRMSRPYPIGYSYNWLCLALTHWQLGKKEEAYRWYDKANDLIAQNPTEDEDLKRWHTEVTEMLGIAEKPEKQQGATETLGEKDTHASEGLAENPEKKQHLGEEN